MDDWTSGGVGVQRRPTRLPLLPSFTHPLMHPSIRPLLHARTFPLYKYIAILASDSPVGPGPTATDIAARSVHFAFCGAAK